MNAGRTTASPTTGLCNIAITACARSSQARICRFAVCVCVCEYKNHPRTLYFACNLPKLLKPKCRANPNHHDGKQTTTSFVRNEEVLTFKKGWTPRMDFFHVPLCSSRPIAHIICGNIACGKRGCSNIKSQKSICALCKKVLTSCKYHGVYGRWSLDLRASMALKSGEVGQGRKLLEICRAQGLEPDTQSFNALMGVVPEKQESF